MPTAPQRPLRLALYARVSTAEQTVTPQLDRLRDYAAARGFAVAREYIDQGQSGAKDRRPALDALLADVRARKVDAVAVVKLDRLARSVRHLLTLAADFEALGVELVAADQGIDTSTPSGRFLFNVLGSVAELERDLIRERTAAGLAAARRRGKRLGRRPTLEGDALERARRMRSAGQSVRHVAQVLGVSKSAVARACPVNPSAEGADSAA
jgi:DNA invertase Pin-like site-specific DNA recombinase